MTCKSILVVDDDEDIRVNLRDALEAEGYSVHLASNGKEALELLKLRPKEELPGCIILDMMMPEMNGVEFLNAINNESSSDLRALPILIATAKGSPVGPSFLDTGLERLRKPFTLDELYEKVSKLCGLP